MGVDAEAQEDMNALIQEQVPVVCVKDRWVKIGCV